MKHRIFLILICATLLFCFGCTPAQELGYACIMMHPNEQHSAWTGTVVHRKCVQ